jgi:UDP-N-acetylmuramate dehydrogenase
MKIFTNCDLTQHNSYRIQARCARAFFPETEEDFLTIYREYGRSKIILGGGFNVILSRPYYEEDFIVIGEMFSRIKMVNDVFVEAEAGVSTQQLSEFSLSHSLTGTEIFYDIPSSLGGAVVMNAGASGEEIKDILVKVKYLDLEDIVMKEIMREDMDFTYRNSFFQKNADKIILTTQLRLQKGDPVSIKEKMERIKLERWRKQPKEFPNAGSVFKRPPGYFVGQLMDELNLKGYTVGGAKVSEKHGGFIINFNGATGQDILDLIEVIRGKVKERYGILLEVEQRVI